MDPLILILSLFGLGAGWAWARKANRLSSPEIKRSLESPQDFIQPQGPFVGTLVIGADRCILGCNDAFCGFFSTNPKEVVGRHITSLFRKSLATRIENPDLLEHPLTQGPVLGNYSPLEVCLRVNDRPEPVRLLHTTAFFEEGTLEGIRVEYFVDVTELSQKTPLKVKPLRRAPSAKLPPLREECSVGQAATIHIDQHLCPTSLSSGAVALLEEGVEEKRLLGHPLSSSAGWLGDSTLLAEIRKALRGGGSAQIRRQLELGGPWADIFIAPTAEGVSLTLSPAQKGRLRSSPQDRPERQRDLFASLSPSHPPSVPTQKTKRAAVRTENRSSSGQTEFFFQSPAGLH